MEARLNTASANRRLGIHKRRLSCRGVDSFAKGWFPGIPKKTSVSACLVMRMTRMNFGAITQETFHHCFTKAVKVSISGWSGLINSLGRIEDTEYRPWPSGEMARISGLDAYWSVRRYKQHCTAWKSSTSWRSNLFATYYSPIKKGILNCKYLLLSCISLFLSLSLSLPLSLGH